MADMKRCFLQYSAPRTKDADAFILFAFSCAGGSVVDFRPLDVAMPRAVRVIGFELPGHMVRITEKFSRSVEDIAPDAADAIQWFLSLPENRRARGYSVLGHSLGGSVAYETCLELERRAGSGNSPKPSVLFVCATSAPHQRGEELAKFRRLAAIEDAMEFVDEQEVVFKESKLKEFYMRSPEGAADFIRIMRADALLLARYDVSYKRADFRGKVAAQIVPLYGTDDPGLFADEMMEWGLYTSAKCHPVEQYSGGHHFIKGSPELAVVAESIARHLSNASRRV